MQSLLYLEVWLTSKVKEKGENFDENMFIFSIRNEKKIDTELRNLTWNEKNWWESIVNFNMLWQILLMFSMWMKHYFENIQPFVTFLNIFLSFIQNICSTQCVKVHAH